MESLADIMNIQPGITAVIGSGGKTTFLRTIGEILSENHTVLLCTTTKIFPFAGMLCARNAAELEVLRKQRRLICAGRPIPESDKLKEPDLPMEELAELFDYVLVEADGSAQRPMKAHADYEPVLPSGYNQVIELIGASGFGRLISEAAHRPGIYARLADVSEEEPITPEIAAKVLRAESLHHRIFINQVESAERAEWARRMSNLMRCPMAAGSLQRGVSFRCE